MNTITILIDACRFGGLKVIKLYEGNKFPRLFMQLRYAEKRF